MGNDLVTLFYHSALFGQEPAYIQYSIENGAAANDGNSFKLLPLRVIRDKVQQD